MIILIKERTASEVLLTIEQKVNNLEKMIQTIDFNVKTLLNKQNSEPARVLVEKPRKKSFVSEQPAPTAEAVEFVQADVSSIDKKCTIQEKLLYENGKPIILAQVEIFDIKGNLVDKRRTNNIGQWMSSLLSGQYVVRIAKQATAAKSAVTAQYDLVVPVGEKLLQLENRKL